MRTDDSRWSLSVAPGHRVQAQRPIESAVERNGASVRPEGATERYNETSSAKPSSISRASGPCGFLASSASARDAAGLA